MRKKNILWVNEFSELGTGFSVIGKSVLTHLFNTNKYNITELGSYAMTSDPRSAMLPWEFYGAMPEPNDENGQRKYQSSVYAQFGELAFEHVCLKSKPDIVIDIRDDWMQNFILKSPFRRYFKFISCPTVDGRPQRYEWLDNYKHADLLLTYSEFGKQTLEEESGGNLKVFDVVRPGVDHNVFRPMDKLAMRRKYGIPNPEKANIVMTVMRNQRRKLYPDLIEMFAKYLAHCIIQNNQELAENTYLYLHTSYPDVGFDIGRHIMQNGVGHRVLVTYHCAACRSCYADFFQSELTSCRKCGALAAHMPNTNNGVSREELAEIYNIADLYIQYSISEGWACPVTEAKACGISAVAVDYSAMSEQVNTYGCWPIRVQKFFHEPVIETEQRRALPDDYDAIQKIYQFFKLPPETKRIMGCAVRKDAQRASLEQAAKVFERAIDSIEVPPHEETWLNPVGQFAPNNRETPNCVSPHEFLDWCIDNILGQPSLKNTQWKYDMVKSLNIGTQLSRGGNSRFTPHDALNMFYNLADIHNSWEQMRLDILVNKDKPKKLVFNTI